MSPDPVEVLLVDDSPDFDVLLPAFKKYAWAAAAAKNGHEAIHALKHNNFDAVVLDRNMPRMAGDAVLQWIHEEFTRLRPCVIVLTGHPSTDSAAEAVEHSAYRYLTKPVAPGALITILRTGIALRRCQGMINDLRTAPSVEEMFRRAKQVLTLACQPDAAGVVFVDKLGHVREIYGHTIGAQVDRVRFVDTVLAGKGQRLYLKTKQELEHMDPMLSDAGSLLAVPVPGDDGYQGVLAIESIKEHAFDAHWTDLLRQLAELIGLAASISEMSMLKSAALLYSEFRHSTATHAQVIAMQADRARESELSNIRDEPLRTKMEARLISITDHAAAIQTVVEDLRTASADIPMDVETDQNLAAILADSVTTARDECADCDPPIALVLDTCPPVVPICGDSMWLSYALNCVLTNAREAIVTERKVRPAGSGEITDAIAVRLMLSEQEATIIIQDSGIGIPKESLDLDLIFRPLFSTKTRTAAKPGNRQPEFIDRFISGLTRAMVQYPDLRQLEDTATLSFRPGSDAAGDTLVVRPHPSAQPTSFTIPKLEFSDKRGIGLYTVRRVINAHGGSIHPASPGFHQGATFRIKLPLV